MIADPCKCKQFVPGQPWRPGQCAVCWHYHHTPAFREGHGERRPAIAATPGREAKTASPRPKCNRRGEPTGEKVQCRTCSGRVELKLFSCSVHGRCTLGKSVPGIACCKGCEDYRTTSPTVDEWVALFRSPTVTHEGGYYHENQTAAVHRIIDDLRAALPPVLDLSLARAISRETTPRPKRLLGMRSALFQVPSTWSLWCR
jgi:hypothetical protein